MLFWIHFHTLFYVQSIDIGIVAANTGPIFTSYRIDAKFAISHTSCALLAH